MDHKSFFANAKTLVDQFQANTREDIFFFHSTLDINNPNFQIDPLDADVFEFLIEDAQKSDTVNLVLHTRGGNYGAAIAIHKLLRDNYKTVKVIIPAVAMSCGTFLAVTSDEIYLHQRAVLGAFDPQIKLLSTYPPNGLYSYLKMFGFQNPGVAPTFPPGFFPNLAKILTDAHADYFAIEAYIIGNLQKFYLVQAHEVDPLIARFYRDDHPDYGHHGNAVDFTTFRKYVSNTKPMDLHPEAVGIRDLFLLGESLINNYQLSRVYLLNDKFHYR